MKLLHALSALPCIAFLLAAAPTANAASINYTSGVIYEGVPGNNGGTSSTTNLPTGGSTSVASGESYGVLNSTYLNSIAGNLNFDCGGTGPSGNGMGTCYFVNTFYGTTNASYSSTGGNGATFSNTASLGDTGLYLSGTIYLPAGSDLLTVDNDDGVVLTINGTTVYNSPGSSYATQGTNNVAVTGTGTFENFTLYYAQNAYSPADLIFQDPYTPATVTPEPASFVLLGTGLFAAAGIVRRRIQA